MPGTLYLVATPIGNLGDISARAIETLRKVKVIAAEDTRRTRILSEKFGLPAQLVSMPAFREEDRGESLLRRLADGDDVAVVSDAGTPGISDPGTALVRRAIDAGITVVPIPGPSAVISALCASGLATDRFLFLGFLPRKGAARERELSKLKREEATLILYESPERLGETLTELAEAFGPRKAVVARELTKLHEEFARGTLAELAARFAGEVKGEITLLVEGAPAEAADAASDEAIEAELRRRLSAGEGSLKEIARDLADATGRPKSEIYNLGLKLKGS